MKERCSYALAFYRRNRDICNFQHKAWNAGISVTLAECRRTLRPAGNSGRITTKGKNMAKATKRAKKRTTKRRRIVLVNPSAKAATAQPGRKFATVRVVTLPELWCKIEKPVYVTILEAVRYSDMGGPAAFAHVKNLETGKLMDLAIASGLLTVLQKNYAVDATLTDRTYVDKSFCIIRHSKHDRKNETGYTVEEIDPLQPQADSAL